MANATKVRVELVPFFDQQMQAEPGVQTTLKFVANMAKGAARNTAPVGATGKYRDSIDVETEGIRVNLVARDFKAHWIEWGTIRTRAHATLRNAARQVARVRED